MSEIVTSTVGAAVQAQTSAAALEAETSVPPALAVVTQQSTTVLEVTRSVRSFFSAGFAHSLRSYADDKDRLGDCDGYDDASCRCFGFGCREGRRGEWCLRGNCTCLSSSKAGFHWAKVRAVTRP